MGRYFIPFEAFGENPAERWDEAYHDATYVYDGDKYVIVRSSSFAEGSFDTNYLVLDRHKPYDGFSAFGPNGKPGLFIDGIKFTPCYIRDNRLVGYIQAIDIVDSADLLTNPDLKAIAATLDEDSNPVIVVATLKK